MLLVAFAFFVIAVFVLRKRYPAETPNSSRLYRVDHRVVAAILGVLSLTFVVLAWTSGRLLF
jgi:amino acid transporter